MLKRTKIAQLVDAAAPLPEVLVKGWVRTRRDAKDFSFIELNDGSCLKNIQIIANNTLNNYDEVKKLTTGSSVAVTGELVESKGGAQKYEVIAKTVEIYDVADEDFPLQKKKHTDEYLRTIAHLRPRTNKYGAAFRIRSELAFAIHKFFNDRGFRYVHTPIITGSDCEGAGEMFQVTTLDLDNLPRTPDGKIDYDKDFFGKEARLTVSGQLNGEMYAMGLGDIYTFGPTFRAENSNTTRHAAEFWMIEPEMAFADLQTDMDLARDMIQFVIRHLLEACTDELRFFNDFYDKSLLERLHALVKTDFAHITYTEAITLLEPHQDQFAYPVFWGCDLQTEHERYLTEQVFQKPVFVTDYPKDIKAFYMRLNDDGKTVAAMDLLVPGVGEIIGGSQREERLELLEQRMAELRLDSADYWWYLDLRRYGGAPHAGFGLGFERLILYVTGMANIRDVIPFPRTTGSAEF